MCFGNMISGCLTILGYKLEEFFICFQGQYFSAIELVTFYSVLDTCIISCLFPLMGILKQNLLFQIMWFLKQVCGPQSFFYEVSFTVNMRACRIMVVTISLISLVYLCSCGSMTYMCVALLIV